MKKKLILGLITAMGVTSFLSVNAKAERPLLEKPAEIKSVGRYEFDEDNDNVPEVVIDSQDIYYLYNLCK